MINVFTFCNFFIVIDGICATNLFQASVFTKNFNGMSAKGFFTTSICLENVTVLCQNNFRFCNARLYVTDNGLSRRFY